MIMYAFVLYHLGYCIKRWGDYTLSRYMNKELSCLFTCCIQSSIKIVHIMYEFDVPNDAIS